jgi:hypothetical protein
MFSVPPVIGVPDIDFPSALGVCVTVLLHALAANPTVQTVTIVVSRLVLRDIEYLLRKVRSGVSRIGVSADPPLPCERKARSGKPYQPRSN